MTLTALGGIQLLAAAANAALGAGGGPAEVRLANHGASNSAKAPTVCIIIRPADNQLITHLVV
jgi:hypothetical protein